MQQRCLLEIGVGFWGRFMGWEWGSCAGWDLGGGGRGGRDVTYPAKDLVAVGAAEVGAAHCGFGGQCLCINGTVGGNCTVTGERTGRIASVGKVCVETYCRRRKRWRAAAAT